MNDDDDALRALYLRVDPIPGAAAPGTARACICIDVRYEAIVALAEQWMLAHVGELTCVRGSGCGCCVIGWDIEGPQAVIETLPTQAGSVGAWPGGGAAAEPRRLGVDGSFWTRFPRRRRLLPSLSVKTDPAAPEPRHTTSAASSIAP